MGKRRMQTGVALLLALTLLSGLVFAVVPRALAAGPVQNVPTNPEDALSLHKYVSKTDEPNVYRVQLSVKAESEELHPPALITFVLDGTSSMTGAMGSTDPTARDVAVREAVIEALRTLAGPANENKESTYINVVMFGSSETTAISLTEWATRGTTTGQGWNAAAWQPKNNAFIVAHANLPGIVEETGRTTTPFTWIDNTARSSGRAYVPLMVNGELNPVLAGLFNVPPATIPNADNGAATAISSVYYYGNPIPAAGVNYYKRFPLSISGTYMGPGLEMAHQDLAAEIPVVTAGLKPKEIAGMKKTVLVLADGDDHVATRGITQSWSTAIKAPATVNIPTFQLTNGLGNAYGGGTWIGAESGATMNPGLAGEIWTLIAGQAGIAIDPAETTWTSGAAGFGGLSLAPVQNMISMAVDLDPANDAIWNTAFSGMTNLAGGQPWLTSFFPAYSANVTNADIGRATSPDPHAQRAVSVAQAQNFFTSFAAGSIPPVGYIGVEVTDVVGSHYDVYQMPGQPLVEAACTETLAPGYPNASVSGQTITWNLGNPQNSTSTLTYYVKIEEGLDASLHYPLNEYASISYYTENNPVANGTPYVVHFPVPYASPGGDVQNEETLPAAPSTAEAPKDDGGMLPLFAIPYGESKVHSPSVTAKKTVLQEKDLQERPAIENETVADAGEEIEVADTATQGEILWMVAGLFLLCVLSALVVAWRRRRG